MTDGKNDTLPSQKNFYTIQNLSRYPNDLIIVTGFWRTEHFVTFDIIYIYVYLRHSRWYYWFNKWLNQSYTT